MDEESTKLAAGKEAIKFCPFCGEEFAERLTLNVKHECPIEGGCSIDFQVFSKNYGKE